MSNPTKQSKHNFVAGKSGPRMTKTDLMLAQKQISKMAKQAVHLVDASSDKPRSEHEAVFEWCVKSATCMLQVMQPRHQKSFVRKLSD